METNINGKRLSQLKFADDISQIVETKEPWNYSATTTRHLGSSDIYWRMRKSHNTLEQRYLTNACCLLTCRAQTWTLAQQTTCQLHVTQMAMQRPIIGITLKDKKRTLMDQSENKSYRHSTGNNKLEVEICWARCKSNKWYSKIIKLTLWERRSRRKGLITRWYEDIKRVAGLKWIEVAQNRKNWKNKIEA